MTNEQFTVIGNLIRSRPGPVQKAAQAVLVDGFSPLDAAERFGIQRRQVYNTVRAFRLAAAKILSTTWDAAPGTLES